MTAVDGLLDAEAATWLTTALAAHLTPTGPHDTRTAAQRRADGLVDLIRTALTASTSDTPALPHLHVLIPVTALPGGPDTEPATLATLPDCPTGPHPLTRQALHRLTCNATLARVLLGADSEILDLGRTRRLYSPAQHRALALPDGGCRFLWFTHPDGHTTPSDPRGP